MMLKRKRKNKFIYPAAGFFLIVISLLFCGIGFSFDLIYKGPKGKKSLLKHDVRKKVKILANKNFNQPYIYDPRGKTDPFRSFIAEQESVEEKRKRKPRTYLETLDLSQLDLIATIVGGKGNWAMVRDAKGIGYVIKKGTFIGINEGIVHEIKDSEVIIREKNKNVSKKIYSIK